MKPKNAVRLDRSIGRFVYKLHLFIYRLTRGLIGHHSSQGPILLLTATGRKSGKRRTHPLLYFPEGVPDPHRPRKAIPSRFIVVGSNGGRPEPPAWLLNLRADPRASVQAGSRRYEVSAEILDGKARDELWPKLVSFYEGWDHYGTLTDRKIYPVALLPIGTESKRAQPAMKIPHEGTNWSST